MHQQPPAPRAPRAGRFKLVNWVGQPWWSQHRLADIYETHIGVRPLVLVPVRARWVLVWARVLVSSEDRRSSNIYSKI